VRTSCSVWLPSQHLPGKFFPARLLF